MTTPNYAYFAPDGSYGMADDMLVIDTAAFTDDDWFDIDMARDNERAEVAARIAMKHNAAHALFKQEDSQ